MVQRTKKKKKKKNDGVRIILGPWEDIFFFPSLNSLEG
jgi:hypothetical protein